MRISDSYDFSHVTGKKINVLTYAQYNNIIKNICMFNRDMLYDRTLFCFVPLPTPLVYLYTYYIILRINFQRVWCV